MAYRWRLRSSIAILVLFLGNASVQQTTTTSVTTPSSATTPLPQSTTTTPQSTTSPSITITTTSPTTSTNSKTTKSVSSKTTSKPAPVIVNNGTAPFPSHSDSGPGGGPNQHTNQSGLVNYYFVFLALILAVIGVLIFFFIRHKRRNRLRSGSAREHALQQDLARGHGRISGGVNGWRFHHGRGWSGEVAAEEGLNEHGEAPPPYLPKRSSEERRRVGTGADSENGGPAIPLQTLSHDGAALKPPDYAETQVRPTDTHSPEPDPTSSGANSPPQPLPPTAAPGERR